MLKKIFIPLMLGASIAIAMPVLSSPVSAYGYNNRNTYSRNSYYRGTYNELASASEVLQAGTVIPATLLTPVISDNMTTTIIAIVRQDVFDSVTGDYLLIPAGSKLIGDPMSMNGRRIDISFNRIIFPNGHSVDLPDYRAIDGVGYSGLKDKYTRHSWMKMRGILEGAIMAGAVDGFSYDSSDSSSDDDNTSAGTDAKKAAISELLSGINDMVKENNKDLRPTGTVREGFQFNVILNTDIRIRPYDETF